MNDCHSLYTMVEIEIPRRGDENFLYIHIWKSILNSRNRDTPKRGRKPVMNDCHSLYTMVEIEIPRRGDENFLYIHIWKSILNSRNRDTPKRGRKHLFKF